MIFFSSLLSFLSMAIAFFLLITGLVFFICWFVSFPWNAVTGVVDLCVSRDTLASCALCYSPLELGHKVIFSPSSYILVLLVTKLPSSQLFGFGFSAEPALFCFQMFLGIAVITITHKLWSHKSSSIFVPKLSVVTHCSQRSESLGKFHSPIVQMWGMRAKNIYSWRVKDKK